MRLGLIALLILLCIGALASELTGKIGLGQMLVFLLLLGTPAVALAMFGGRTRYCTVCQKPVQAIGGLLSGLRCPMCRNSGTLQKLR
jgi:hypothetical protein